MNAQPHSHQYTKGEMMREVGASSALGWGYLSQQNNAVSSLNTTEGIQAKLQKCGGQMWDVPHSRLGADFT